MYAYSVNSLLLIAILASAAFISANAAAIDSPESHSIENVNSTSDESTENINVAVPRLQRAASLESEENNSTESSESDEITPRPRPIPIQEPRGCNVTLNLERIPADFVCDSWEGGRQGAPFVKECDCDWRSFHNCLCVVKSGWATCLKDCKQLRRNVKPEASGPQ